MITLENIEAWLRTKEPHRFIGRPADAYSCPVARYIRQRVPKASLVSVGHFSYGYRLGDENIEGTITDHRVSRFIEVVDACDDTITVAKALAIIEEVKNEHLLP
jgi:hypothetical protein